MTALIELRVPDIGDFNDVPVIELQLSVGDSIQENDTVMVLEGDKATLDVPALSGGKIVELLLVEGDVVSRGTLIARLEVVSSEGQIIAGNSMPVDEPVPEESQQAEGGVKCNRVAPVETSQPREVLPVFSAGRLAHASPSVRKFARELDVDVNLVKGTGSKLRITRNDIVEYVKKALASTAPVSGSGLDLPAWPIVDYAQFGPIERVKLSRIAKISGPALARNSVFIPHVTNFEKADITDLESFRKNVNSEPDVVKMSILAFVVKATATALKQHPKFNSSLDGDELILKEYYNLGVAVDTPDGLMVPVIKDVNRKSLREIAAEMIVLAEQARAGKLKLSDMQGGTFTISSLGGIGGENFTPIINAPEVAILGMVRSSIQPVWDGVQFQPRLMQPLSLSWDHRVVDGVAAAHFLKTVQATLQDFRRISL
ncbi:2-oxo acid dehydrogenase subunit E2 [Granulosicoccus antarcticus]|uniref:Dihydrolipoamide acetyltransferase component of pyruvate dehydrogenase complex n=1 Tax=Granulosicoccus antarcticus IMCC3135 TaxID=1192854 RepID=A0A2Z2NVA5_9GAMM|nr:2-oxo acid dehydrogenase subunit E2 [Granulosicoccus antarcticus]ASJ75472.1 Dihydrolipoyllysine-residue acetyltransferase component of pyruvate dehydrogenase complex [Granulosicoccus antarcticus IMCC3135]